MDMKWIIRCNIDGIFLLPFCQCLLILFLHFNFEEYLWRVLVTLVHFCQHMSPFDCGMIWEMLETMNALHCWDLVSLIPEAITSELLVHLGRTCAFWLLQTLFELLMPKVLPNTQLPLFHCSWEALVLCFVCSLHLNHYFILDMLKVKNISLL